VYTLKDCANIADAEVKCFENEEDLLMAFSDLIMAVDPDILLGYNIINFDWPYLIGRAEHLKVKAFSQLGRILGTRST
jgi:DNA polymerase delta subunit 1